MPHRLLAPPRRHLLSAADLDRPAIERICALAAGFEEVAAREVKKVPTLRGRTDREPVLRVLDAHQRVVRARRQAAVRRHPERQGRRLVGGQGRVSQGHDPHARRLRARRAGHPPPADRRTGPGRPLHQRRGGQRRRRQAPAPDPEPARPVHDPRGARPARGHPRRDRGRRPALARGPLRDHRAAALRRPRHRGRAAAAHPARHRGARRRRLPRHRRHRAGRRRLRPADAAGTHASRARPSSPRSRSTPRAGASPPRASAPARS